MRNVEVERIACRDVEPGEEPARMFVTATEGYRVFRGMRLGAPLEIGERRRGHVFELGIDQSKRGVKHPVVGRQPAHIGLESERAALLDVDRYKAEGRRVTGIELE